MTRQDQRVSEGGQAIQAARDVVVNQGMSASQMTEIMVGMARQLSEYQAEARSVVEERLASFRDEILKAFADQTRTRAEAFKDPDFQFSLNEAQKEFARSGDEAVRGTLVDIIARRSLETERNRIAIALNDAAEKAPRLTKNEFSALSVIYLIRYVRSGGINTFANLCAMIRRMWMPFVPDLTREPASYWHLQSQSCANIETGEISIPSVLKATYPHVFFRGLTFDEIALVLRDDRKNALQFALRPSDFGENALVPAVSTLEKFKQVGPFSGLSEGELEQIWNRISATQVDDVELQNRIVQEVPGTEALFDIMNNSSLKNLTLNNVGIAIAHANAVRVVGFDADLSIWLK